MTAADGEKVHDSPILWVKGHAKAYDATGGRVGHVVRGLPNLLLTTRGRRSGLLRRTPLVYVEDDGAGYVVIASNGGAERHPQWYLNLVADPAVTVQVGDRVFEARAMPVPDDDYQRCWGLILGIMPWCADYRTRRRIPLVRLVGTARDAAEEA